MPAPTHLLYLHGFRSSPRSTKAQMLGAAIERLQQRGENITWCCPQLPPSPAQALADLRALTAHWPAQTSVVIGSSLGGFYATVLAQEKGWRLAVINPAVRPARELARHIGEQTAFHDPDERFFFRPEFIAELEALEALAALPFAHPQRHWALIAKGDEVLDWREMLSHHPGAQVTLLEGSDHAVSDFDAHLPGLLRWLGWDAPSG